MKRHEKKLIRNSIAIGILVVIIIYASINFFTQKSKSDVVSDATAMLESAIDNDGDKYITLSMTDDAAVYTYKLQFYGDGKSYYIFNSVNDDVDFSIESYCDGEDEYVKSNYTSGFEYIAKENCAQRTYNLNYGITGFDLSFLTHNDFIISESKGVTKLTVKEDKLSNEVFLGDYAGENNVKVKKIVITSKDDITSLDIEFNHALYGDIVVNITVEETRKLDVPEYK